MAKKKKYFLLNRRQKVALVVIAISIIAYYSFRFFHTSLPAHYPEFGIEIPPNYSVHGIDVSRYQRVINWHAVKEMKVKDIQIEFAFIKATEGLESIDVQFNRNWSGAEAAGMTRGAYHYFIPGKNGKAQAGNFIQKVMIKSGDLPPVIDVEQIFRVDPQTMRQQLSDWLHQVEAAYNVKPIIYTHLTFYNKYLKGYFNEYSFWFSDYLQPDKPATDDKWIFWQHSDKGRVDGIETPVDFDVFSGSRKAFRKLLLP